MQPGKALTANGTGLPLCTYMSLSGPESQKVDFHTSMCTYQRKTRSTKKNDSKAQKDSTGCHNVQADVTK